MRESAVFLSFGYPEGFGLPAAEAMRSGCVVVGYHGDGGREFLTHDHGFPIEAGDLLGFARTAESVLALLCHDPNAFAAMTDAASKFISSVYSPEHEREDTISAWKEILARAKRS